MAINLSDFQGGTVPTTLINAMLAGLKRISNIAASSAIGTAALAATSTTSYTDVTGTSISWQKQGDASGSDVIVGAAVSCFVGTANVQPMFGVKIGATDYDLVAMTIVPTSTHVQLMGFRVISGVAAATYAPLIRFKRNGVTVGNTTIDAGDTVSFIIGELPK